MQTSEGFTATATVQRCNSWLTCWQPYNKPTTCRLALPALMPSPAIVYVPLVHPKALPDSPLEVLTAHSNAVPAAAAVLSLLLCCLCCCACHLCCCSCNRHWACSCRPIWEQGHPLLLPTGWPEPAWHCKAPATGLMLAVLLGHVTFVTSHPYPCLTLCCCLPYSCCCCPYCHIQASSPITSHCARVYSSQDKQRHCSCPCSPCALAPCSHWLCQCPLLLLLLVLPYKLHDTFGLKTRWVPCCRLQVTQSLCCTIT